MPPKTISDANTTSTRHTRQLGGNNSGNPSAFEYSLQREGARARELSEFEGTGRGRRWWAIVHWSHELPNTAQLCIVCMSSSRTMDISATLHTPRGKSGQSPEKNRVRTRRVAKRLSAGRFPMTDRRRAPQRFVSSPTTRFSSSSTMLSSSPNHVKHHRAGFILGQDSFPACPTLSGVK